MKKFEELRDWARRQREQGHERMRIGNLLTQVYRPKLPGDEVVFNIRRDIPGEEADITFVEHFATENLCGKFWVYINKEEDKRIYPNVHEEFKLSASIEKLKEVFSDGRFDYIIDTIIAFDGVYYFRVKR